MATAKLRNIIARRDADRLKKQLIASVATRLSKEKLKMDQAIDLGGLRIEVCDLLLSRQINATPLMKNADIISGDLPVQADIEVWIAAKKLAKRHKKNVYHFYEF